MVMFKTRFRPERSDKPSAAADKRSAGKPSAGARMQQQQQQQPEPPQKDKVPPIEEERGPQYPVREPGPSGPPERAR
jgi:hypothetical protein